MRTQWQINIDKETLLGKPNFPTCFVVALTYYMQHFFPQARFAPEKQNINVNVSEFFGTFCFKIMSLQQCSPASRKKKTSNLSLTTAEDVQNISNLH